MRRLLLTIPILLLSITAVTQQPAQNALPNPDDFVPAGPSCKKKVNVSPWVGTPGVDWPRTFQCVLVVHTCDGPKTYRSGERPAGTTMCDDYWRVHNALANREICCDAGVREEKPKQEEPKSSPSKCEPPAQWFDSSTSCKEMETPQLVIAGTKATLSMCGHTVFEYSHPDFPDKLSSDAYKAAVQGQLQISSASKVCCDKFREAIRTGKPCDPSIDLDCDSIPNKTDTIDGQVPDIDTFIRPANAEIDPFPYGLDTSNPDFMPNRTAGASKGVGDCPCKWELVKGELNCSKDGKEKHYYKATWRCPQTGAEVFTVRYAAPTVPCLKAA